MERAETTRFLGELLVSSRFSGMGKYWASEVSIDAFTTAGKGGRVDFMQFEFLYATKSRVAKRTYTAGMV